MEFNIKKKTWRFVKGEREKWAHFNTPSPLFDVLEQTYLFFQMHHHSARSKNTALCFSNFLGPDFGVCEVSCPVHSVLTENP